MANHHGKRSLEVHRAKMAARRVKRGNPPKKGASDDSSQPLWKSNKAVIFAAAGGLVCFCAVIAWQGYSARQQTPQGNAASLPKLELPKGEFKPEPPSHGKPYCLEAYIPHELRAGSIKLFSNYPMHEFGSDPEAMARVVSELNSALDLARSHDAGLAFNKDGEPVGAYRQGILALELRPGMKIPQLEDYRYLGFHNIRFGDETFTIMHTDYFEHVSGTVMKIGGREVDIGKIMYQVSNGESSLVMLMKDSIRVEYTVDAERCDLKLNKRQPAPAPKG